VLIITPTPACLRCCLQSSMSTPYRSPAHQATSSVPAFPSEFRARGQTRPLELLLPMLRAGKGIFTARSILCPASSARQSFSRFFPGVRSCHLMTRPSESTERHEKEIEHQLPLPASMQMQAQKRGAPQRCHTEQLVRYYVRHHMRHRK